MNYLLLTVTESEAICPLCRSIFNFIWTVKTLEFPGLVLVCSTLARLTLLGVSDIILAFEAWS